MNDTTLERILDMFADGLNDHSNPHALHPLLRGEGEIWLAQVVASENISAPLVASVLRQWQTHLENQHDRNFMRERVSDLLTLSYQYAATPYFMLILQETLHHVQDAQSWGTALLLLQRLSFLLTVSKPTR